jgi:hypothetical protein
MDDRNHWMEHMRFVIEVTHGMLEHSERRIDLSRELLRRSDPAVLKKPTANADESCAAAANVAMGPLGDNSETRR